MTQHMCDCCNERPAKLSNNLKAQLGKGISLNWFLCDVCADNLAIKISAQRYKAKNGIALVNKKPGRGDEKRKKAGA